MRNIIVILFSLLSLQSQATTVLDSLIVENSCSLPSLTSGRALYLDGTNKVQSSVTTSTELSYLSGVTAPIQPQLNSLNPTFRSVSSSGNITTSDNRGWVRVTGLSAVVLTLPDISAFNMSVGIDFQGTGSLTINSFSGGQTIIGQTSLTINTQYTSLTLVSQGGLWSIY